MAPHRSCLPALFLIVGAMGAVGVQAHLTGDGDQLWAQSTPQGGEYFGQALASGDFNGDGFGDLAIGAPNRNVFSLPDAGQVLVLYGSASGLSSAGQQLWDQDVDGVADEAEGFDYFGAALAVGDFDRDGHDDLAIGVPGENLSEGAVHILFGGSGGLTSDSDQFITQATTGISDSPEFEDYFGLVLVAGDFNGDNCSDLAIGVPGETLNALGLAGAVHVVYGSRNVGLIVDGESFWHQDIPGLNEAAESGDEFGAALAVGDFNGDGADDLVVGVPGEEAGGLPFDSGLVHVLYGGDPDGITASGSVRLTQNTVGVDDVCEESDHFGDSLVAGDFNGDGYDDAVVGVPREDLGFDDSGIVHVFTGGADGLTGNREEIWHQARDGVADHPGVDDYFGQALAAAPIDGNEWDALAVGIAGEVINDPGYQQGAVAVLYGGPSGVTASGNQFLHQGLPDLLGTAEDQDTFGYAITSGDFDDNGSADLAVGVPGQQISGMNYAGEVHVLYSVPVLFRDGFEIGDTSGWSAAVGGP